MAILTINEKDFTTKLKDFSFKCSHCGSTNVSLDIDWACYPSDSWLDISVYCEVCKTMEDVRKSD